MQIILDFLALMEAMISEVSVQLLKLEAQKEMKKKSKKKALPFKDLDLQEN